MTPPINRLNNRVYCKLMKSEIPNENLCLESKRQSKKVMVSAAVTWYGATEAFFVAEEGIKINKFVYHKHLKEELLPAIKRRFNRDNWIFIQDGAPSHRSKLVQEYLDEELPRRFVRENEWPPSSPDSNPLDYYFWSAVESRVYAGRGTQPFSNLSELKARIQEVWSECSNNVLEIRKSIKQFVPRLRAIEEKQGYSIKMLFG